MMRYLAAKVKGRAGLVGSVLVFAFVLLFIRVVVIQTTDYESYRAKVTQQLTTRSSDLAERGSIKDADGITLATSVTTYRVFISPVDVLAADEKEGDRSRSLLVCDVLSETLSVDAAFVLEQIDEYAAYYDRTIAKNVSQEKADILTDLIAEYGLSRMIYLDESSTRYYPYGSLASHVLGFTNSAGVGLYGLENYYNDELSGKSGQTIYASDSRGNDLLYDFDQVYQKEDGLTLVSTLKVYVQQVLEQQLYEAWKNTGAENRVCGIVMDVNTGAILAMATYPDFDLNSPWALNDELSAVLSTSGLTSDTDAYEKRRTELLTEMWSNKTITEPYIPGSTFKVITSSMALEEKLVDLSETFYCPGYLKVNGITIRCHETRGHGKLTFAQGLQQSCNPILMTVGLRLGTDVFYDYFASFGYLERTGIDLPGEAVGIFYNRSDFTKLNLATSSFGQNFKVTPLAQITAIAAVANGGYLVTPHLIEGLEDTDGNRVYTYQTQKKVQVISEETCRTVTAVLEEGVAGNGGARNAYVAGFRIAAKTGTSEKIGDKADAYICSCVAYAPADNPQYACIIVVDEPTLGTLYGSAAAAPYVSNVMELILPYLGVEAVYTEKETSRLAVTVPSYCYWGTETAVAYAETAGFRVEVIGEGKYVMAQSPAAGAAVEKDAAVLYFYCGNERPEATVQVPNLLGMTAAAAHQTLVNANLNVLIKGTNSYLYGTEAVAVSQTPAAGEYVAPGAAVTVNFLYLNDDDSDADISVSVTP